MKNDAYEKKKEMERQRNAENSRLGRDIGEIPTVANPELKKKASKNFRLFCESYFPEVFTLAWSDDHLKVIAKIEKSVIEGGLFAMALPRGSGKSSLVEIACLWAILFGHRLFVCLIGSDESHATSMLGSLRTELETNDRLLEDFPEVCYPIRCLEGISGRAQGQLHLGARTCISWNNKELVLPTIPDSKASGAIVKVAGITGRIRGMKFKRPDGKSVRPSLVVIDDPQTDESARSPSQCANREAILAGAVLGLAGPGKKIAGFMPCTVISPGDMAERILDRETHPQWQGERTKMMYQFPKNEKLWEKYAQIRAESLKADKGLSEATVFYEKHRDEMDLGAVVAWEARYNPDEISAIQHAMNLKLQDEAAFFAEYQNDPLADLEDGDEEVTADQIVKKLNRYRRNLIPIACTKLTAFIDVQKKMLYYLILALEDNFTGYVIDYGSFPDQKLPYFTLRESKRTLANLYKEAGLEGRIYSGLEDLAEMILGEEYDRDDGVKMRVDRCLIDANWGQSTDVVYQFCRQSKFASILTPSHGRYVGASSLPFSEYKKKKGERVGHNWRQPNASGRRVVRYVTYDTNYWKSFVHTRLQVAMGDRGCLSLWGRIHETHRMIAEHITAEKKFQTTGRGRVVDEWKQKPEKPDNHLFDCLVGAHVAGSMEGVALDGMQIKAAPKKSRIKLSDLKKKR